MHSFPRFAALAAVFFASLLETFAAPTVTVTSPVPGTTVSALSSISITFNEAVTSVDADDLQINGDAALLLTGSGAGPYVFTFTQPPPGTVTVVWAGDHGIAGQGGTGAFLPGASWTYTLTDTIAPTVSELTPATAATVGSLTQVEVLFSEVVMGVDAADLTINGAPAATVTGSGFGPYVFTFPQPPVGTVSFAWEAANSIVDTALAPNAFGGGTWSVTRSATGIGNLVINEFLAANGTGIVDENGDQEDWIEIHNAGTAAVNLAGWALTNDPEDLGQWVFPARTLNAGAYLVVFASEKNRRPASGNLHTNFKINETGGYLALSGPEFPRVAASFFPPNYSPTGTTEYPEQRTNYSYGPLAGGGALRYFATPTPGTGNNASTLTAITARVNFSVSRGYFKEPFQLVLACPDAGVTIRYTTDFTEPTVSSGSVYSAPLAISATTCIRAVAFSLGKIPSLPVTQTYLFLDQVLAQPSAPANFPTHWGTSYGGNVFTPASSTAGLVPADYAMDTDPVRVTPNNPASAIDSAKLQMLQDGLRELPLVSVTIPMIDMFGTNGLYYYPNVTNKSFGYKKCSVEMVLPDGSTAFTTVCGISGHGNASRDPLKNPKHGFQLKFKGDFGDSSLAYKLYPDSPVDDFDDLILRPDFNTSWRHWSDDTTNGTGAVQRTRGTRIRDAFVKDTFRAMGNIASYHRFFHLFINGLYWGTYDFAEQPVDGFGKSYLGGTKADYDVIHEGAVRAGDANVYNAMLSIPSVTTNANYEQMKTYLDVPEFIDYMLLHFYIGHQDWGDVKNWYAIRRRASATNPTQGKYQYIPWDDECTLLETTVNRVSTTDVPSGLHTKLVSHAQYRLDFADRVHRSLIAPTGALAPTNNIARWQKWQAVMDKPMMAEACRWGDYRRDFHSYQTGLPAPLYTREAHFLPECVRLTGTYFPGRPATLRTQLQSAGLYPSVAAPEYHETSNGGATIGAIIGSKQVNAGALVALVRPGTSGTIYHTTDGNDPHIYYTPTTGASLTSVAATAVAYTAPIAINATTTIKSRVLAGGIWSALNEATFTLGAALPAVRITELMYNPPGGNAYEFLELQNTGTQALDLSGWSFDGLGFVFPLGTILNASDRLVLGNNDGRTGSFAAQYPGVAVFGWFSGSLDNGGERVALLDADGRTIVSVDYDDAAPWPTTPDGGGFSLEIRDANGNPDSPANWKASGALKGTPGQANSALPITVVLNEVLADNAGGVLVNGQPHDYLELTNLGASAVDLNGWSVLAAGATYTFNSSTVLSPGGFLVLPASPSASGVRLPVALSSTSGVAQLRNSGGVTVDAISYGPQIANRAIGRVDSAWVLTTPTVGASNTAAATATAAGNLFLNEWLSVPLPGSAGWLELYNAHASLPVALQGLSFQTDTQLYRYPALSFVAPLGWLQLFCDELPGANHLDFTLPVTGTTLTILDANALPLETVSFANFGAPAQGVTRGRLPDGTATFATFNGTSSPGAANYGSTWNGPIINEIVARNATGAQAPWGTRADWIELTNPTVTPFALAGLKLGTSANPTAAWTFPAGASIPANGVLAIWCDSAQPASTSNSADLNTGFALGDASGAAHLFNASGQLVNRIEWGFQIVDRSIGLDAGGVKLLANPTRGAANSGAATLGPVNALRINEWLSSPVSGGDWFELYNTDANPIALGGLYLSDDPSEVGRKRFLVPPLSFIAGNGWVKWEADGAPELGRNHVNFSLDASAEYLRISNADAAVTTLDAVSVGQQISGVAQGRFADGQAVELLLAPTPGAANVLLTPPTFAIQPLSVIVPQGGNAFFSAGVSSASPLTFQWKFGAANISGATNASLSVPNVTLSWDGTFTLLATNAAGSTTSNPATLKVAQTFAQWLTSRGLSGLNAAADADPDGDGLSNAAEFFHNLSPLLQTTAADRAALPQVSIEPPTGAPQFLTLTYRQNARALPATIEHQRAAMLGAAWNTVTPDVIENLAPDAVTGDPRVRVKFSITPGDVQEFLRLRLTP